jgi:flavin reductase (DIM6/NTAB) family NADH-FMN oxidoreductase RutF
VWNFNFCIFFIVTFLSQVFNLLTDNYLEEANQCSAAYPPTVSEITETNLTTLPSKSIQTPRLQQAKISMECKLDSTKELYNERGEHTTTIVMGTIVHFHIHESVLKYKNDDKDYPIVDLEQLRAVGRAGDISYWPTGEGKVVKMTRP